MATETGKLDQPRQSLAEAPWRVWLPIVVGLLLLYLPTYWELAKHYWSNEAGAQGPILLAAVLLIVWSKRNLFELFAGDAGTLDAAGWALVLLALVMYLIGRSQQFIQLEVASQIPLDLGIAALLLGWQRAAAFLIPAAFILSLVPVPGSLIDVLLLPLKNIVSSIVTNSLFDIGLPVARDGVTIYAGPYQLLVANACAGLNSMIALTAVGLIYAYLSSQKTRPRTLILVCAALPIAFLANLIRVTCIVLATLEGGDASGRYFHAFAAYGEIVFAFGAFLAFDKLLSAFPNFVGRTRGSESGIPS